MSWNDFRTKCLPLDGALPQPGSYPLKSRLRKCVWHRVLYLQLSILIAAVLVILREAYEARLLAELATLRSLEGRDGVEAAVRYYLPLEGPSSCINASRTFSFLRWDVGLPDVFLTRMTEEAQCRLEQMLRRCDENEYFCQPKQVLIVHVQNGLGNRLRVLASAMEFAFLTKRVLVVVWAKDPHLQADMHILFDEEVMSKLIVIDRDIPWPLSNSIPSDLPLHYDDSFVYINRMEKDTTRKYPNPIVQNVPGRHMYVKTAYVFDKTRDAPDMLANSLIQSLRPSLAVLEMVADVERRHGPLRNLVGVHMRTKYVQDENHAIEADREYTSTSIQIANRWRSMSSPSNFAPAMIALLKTPYPTRIRRQMRAAEIETWHRSPVMRFLPDSWAPHDSSNDNQPQFFVSSDDEKAIEEVRALCKCSVIYIPQKCRERSRDCIVSAFADIIALSRCGALLLSGWSSFSEAATRFRVRDDEELASPDKNLFPIKLSGVNFGLKPSPAPVLSTTKRAYVTDSKRKRTEKKMLRSWFSRWWR